MARPMSFTGTRTGVLGSRGGVRVDARLVGGPQLVAALARLEKGMKDELLQNATLAGAKVLEEAWKERAASTVGLGPGTAHFVDAIESSARPGKRGATGIVRLGKESLSEGEDQPVVYGVQTEFGGRGRPARPTLRPAFDAVQGQMLDAMSDELRALIEAATPLMAGPIAKLYATLGLDAREFSTGVDTAQKKTQSFASSFKSQAKAGFGIGAGIGAFGLVTKGIGAAVDFIGDSVKAAIEETKGIATLTQAIEANDAAWDGNVDAIEEVISARTKLAFADDEQRASLQKLVSVTGDVQKALELQRTAMDLARLRGIDLATAGDLIGKVYAGNLGTLSRYGIILKEGTTATEALAEIQRRAAGSAEAYAETAGGQMEVAQLALNDAMEDFGAALLPVVTELMPHFINLVGLAADGAKVFDDVLSGTDPGAIAPLIEDMKALREAEAAAALGQQTLSGDWAASGTPLDSMVDGINSLMGGLESVSPARQEFLKWDAALRDAADRLGLTTDQLNMFRFEAEAAGLTVEEAAAKLEAFADKSLLDAFDPLAGATIEPPDLVTPIRESFKLATAEVAKGFGGIKDALENPPQMIAKGQRLENMQGRLREIMRNIKASVEKGDPWALNYWEAARAKQQAAYDRLKGRTKADLGDVRQTYKQAGIAVEGTWTDTTYAVTAASRKSADAAIAEMQRAKSTIASMDMVQTGTDLMTSLGIGFENAAPSLYAAADRIAAEIRRRLNAPPPPPTVPAATSSGVVIHGNVYGGKAGLRQLDREREKATRPTNRYRRHNNLAEG